MEKINKILLAGLMFLLTTSCKKSFVDLVPPTQIITASFYKTKADIDAGVNAAYGSLQPIYFDMFIFTEVATDNTFTPPEAIGAGHGDYDVLPVPVTQLHIATIWNKLYTSIARSNIVLDRIDAISMDATLKTRYKAELKFIRALAYFNLVRLFGGVPLITKEVASVDDLYTYGRETVDNVYTQIIKDLQEADADLPPSYAGVDVGRVTKYAAKALLGEVYLTKKQYAQAVTKFQEVISASTYSLLPNYTDIFRADNGNNAEVIFSIQYTKGGIGEGSPFANRFVPPFSTTTSGILVGQAIGYSQLTPNLANSFDPADKRKTASVGSLTYYYTKKYLDVPSSDHDADNDWIVIRYADVLLMYAEALNETSSLSEAITNLNLVRARAGLPPKTIVDVPDQAAFRLAVENERRWELSMEGHRWFDLARTERLKPVMDTYYALNDVNRGTATLTLQPYALLFPIPKIEVDKNPTKVPQNPGYQ